MLERQVPPRETYSHQTLARRSARLAGHVRMLDFTIHNDSHLFPMLGGQNVVEEGRFAGAKEAGEDGDGDGFHFRESSRESGDSRRRAFLFLLILVEED